MKLEMRLSPATTPLRDGPFGKPPSRAFESRKLKLIDLPRAGALAGSASATSVSRASPVESRRPCIANRVQFYRQNTTLIVTMRGGHGARRRYWLRCSQSPETESWGSAKTLSSPGPHEIESLPPKLARITSLPLPPTRWSLPSFPRSVSLPSPPSRLSFRRRPACSRRPPADQLVAQRAAVHRVVARPPSRKSLPL